MTTIAAFWIRKLADLATSEGVDGEELLLASGIERRRIDGDEPVHEDAHYTLWEKICERIADPCGFPIRFPRSIEIDEYGALGLAWKTAQSIRSAFDRLVRYHHVLTETSNFQLVEIGDGLRVVFHRSGHRRLGMRCANEAALAEAVQAIRSISGKSPVAMSTHFMHSPPADTSAHDDFFGGPIYWDAQIDALEIDEDVLRWVPRHSDPGLHAYLDKQLQKASEEQTRSTPLQIEYQVRRTLIETMPDGVPKMKDVAKRMGMSTRTLHRRLEESGVSFRELVESTRRGLAEDLLKRSQHPVGEVAFLAGFSDVSSFHRAFKRWTGQTPANFRAS